MAVIRDKSELCMATDSDLEKTERSRQENLSLQVWSQLRRNYATQVRQFSQQQWRAAHAHVRTGRLAGLLPSRAH